MVKDPRHLGAGKVRIEHQAGALPDQALGADFLQFRAARGGAAVLPDDGRINRLAGLAIPDDGGFALVGDAAGDQVVGLQA